MADVKVGAFCNNVWAQTNHERFRTFWYNIAKNFIHNRIHDS